MFLIVGKSNQGFRGKVFGYFTTEPLAEKGFRSIPDACKDKLEVKKSNLRPNTLVVKGNATDFTAAKSAEEIIAARDGNNRVEGYISVHISDLINRNYEEFLDFISEELVGSVLLMGTEYEVVGIDETVPNTLILKVSGDASMVIEEDSLETDDSELDETG